MQTEYRNINQGGRARRPARHAANVRVPPQSGGQRAARVRQPGPYGYPAVPGPRTVRGARAAARRRQKRRRRLVTLGLACLTLAIVLLAVLRQTSAAQPAGTEGGAAGQSAALPTAAAPHEGPPYTIAIDAGHGGTDIGAEGVINEIQLTEATIGYLEGWLTQDENYTPVRTHAADTFSKNTERAAAANSAGASLLLSVHGNSDPYSSDS